MSGAGGNIRPQEKCGGPGSSAPPPVVAENMYQNLILGLASSHGRLPIMDDYTAHIHLGGVIQSSNVMRRPLPGMLVTLVFLVVYRAK